MFLWAESLGPAWMGQLAALDTTLSMAVARVSARAGHLERS